jgi:hypothetical protein
MTVFMRAKNKSQHLELTSDRINEVNDSLEVCIAYIALVHGYQS